MPELPHLAVSRRRATLVAAALTLALPSRAAGQGAVLSTSLLYAAGNAAPCGNGTQIVSTLAARGARVSLLPAPVTAFSRDRIGSPVVAAGYETDPRRAWQFMASGAVGSSSEACAMRSNESRALVGVGRRIGDGGLLLTVGARSLSSLDPARDQRGVTVGAWRSMGRARLSLELRGHDGRTSGWRYTTVYVPATGLQGKDSSGQHQFSFSGSGGRLGRGAQGTPSSFSFFTSAGVASP